MWGFNSPPAHHNIILLNAMKRLAVLFLISFCLYVSGCSLPSAVTCGQLYSFTKGEEKIKGGFGKKKAIWIKDFRENDAYQEDIGALNQEIESYISGHPNLGDSAKSNLRELKVTEGAAKEEVELLLGKPDKIANTSGRLKYGATQIWIYKVNKMRVFTVFIVPIFPVHEGYYLYFADNILAAIEKHYLKQLIRQEGGPGVLERAEKTTE